MRRYSSQYRECAGRCVAQNALINRSNSLLVIPVPSLLKLTCIYESGEIIGFSNGWEDKQY